MPYTYCGDKRMTICFEHEHHLCFCSQNCHLKSKKKYFHFLSTKLDFIMHYIGNTSHVTLNNNISIAPF